MRPALTGRLFRCNISAQTSNFPKLRGRYGLLSSDRTGRAHWLSSGPQRGGNIPHRRDDAPRHRRLRHRMPGVFHSKLRDGQPGGRKRQAVDGDEARRLPRERLGGGGKTQRALAPHLCRGARAERCRAVARGNAQGAAALLNAHLLPGQFLRCGRLLPRLWRFAARLPVCGADGAYHRLCHAPDGQARDQPFFQHHCRGVCHGGAGVFSCGASPHRLC